MNRLIATAISSMLLVSASSAFAKRQARDGFNFGLGVRAIGQDDSTTGSEKSDESTRSSESQAFTPHLGFVIFDYFNIGLEGYFDNETVNETFQNNDHTQEIDRETSSKTNGGGLYTRFMFANHFHFSFGAGIYDHHVKETSQFTNKSGNGNFTGASETSSRHGVGPGYSVGFGLEIPVVQGFFFSTDYIARYIQIRDYQEGGGVGKKSGQIEKRELTFGLSHYIN